MKMNEKKFFKTEFGSELDQTVKALDAALEERSKYRISSFDEKTKKAQEAVMNFLHDWMCTSKGLEHFTELMCVSPGQMNILASAQKMRAITL